MWAAAIDQVLTFAKGICAIPDGQQPRRLKLHATLRQKVEVPLHSDGQPVSEPMPQRGEPRSVVRCSRVNDLRDLGYFGYRYSAEFGVLADRCFAVCKIYAVCAVAGNIAMLPLNRRANLRDGLVRCPCGAA